jgi:hypothetical protein
MYSVRCRLSLDFHLSCLWKTWPSGQAISSRSQLGGQGNEAQSIKLSRHDIRFIFACQEEFVEGEATRARPALQIGRVAGLVATPNAHFLSAPSSENEQTAKCVFPEINSLEP